MNKQELINMFDYTLLKPTATKDDITAFCNETIENGFKTVFVNPYYVAHAHSLLSPHQIKVGVPIGFSLGGATTHTKVEETKEAIKNGAEEIDMLINLGALKSGDLDVVKYDIAEVVKASEGLTTKVIIETALLTKEEKIAAANLIVGAGADFVKTATGFNGGGATVEDVQLLRSIVGEDFGVKAAGGVRTYEDAVNIVKAGANRIGTSGAIAIISGDTSTASY
ncbi:deoxyribose-phosphate aldolase [Virgibacillus profundi]|uniref:Deoxyribose-phosphate aldolase n=1 Tax=Virgibacillus profundi TaxID=2024555 RepID=A0A2A2IJH6_9BACI|nr:deoxyribose-phosphate aldolase [Virgibacillus profundi]PAV31263.1 deoxyribose-phosphate aldolase [Virgibacillus profundi]PXY55448.1 deoxyribose-phosphate aldolase [Virgibacillus profundi]